MGIAPEGGNLKVSATYEYKIVAEGFSLPKNLLQKGTLTE
jgi:hypothetical protein